MKRLLLISAFATTAFSLLSACGGTTNININRAANTAGNAANTVANTAANAANTVANTASSAMTASPDSFMKDAAQSGLAEVELGKLAAQKAKDPEVKKFGQMMVDDHGKANTELKTLAGSKNVTLPTDLGSHQSSVDDLKKVSGADFDRDYVDIMVDAHETDVAAFERQANNGTDAEVKAFAAKALPTLRKHLEAIKAIQAKVSGGGTTGNTNANKSMSNMKH